MNTSFEQMAALEVPGGFPGVDELADEASRYMSEAVSCYHQAYEGESFDATAAEMAYYNGFFCIAAADGLISARS